MSTNKQLINAVNTWGEGGGAHIHTEYNQKHFHSTSIIPQDNINITTMTPQVHQVHLGAKYGKQRLREDSQRHCGHGCQHTVTQTCIVIPGKAGTKAAYLRFPQKAHCHRPVAATLTGYLSLGSPSRSGHTDTVIGLCGG